MHMRRLTSLLIRMIKVGEDSTLSGLALLDREHFYKFLTAIDDVCVEEETYLRLAFGYPLKKACDVVSASYLVSKQDA